jgi:hypothetical protein
MISNKHILMASAAVFVTGYLVGSRASAEGVPELTDYINPNSQHNIVYQMANAVLQTLTDNQNADLGFWVYDLLNSSNGTVEVIPQSQMVYAYPVGMRELGGYYNRDSVPPGWVAIIKSD